MMKRKRIGLMMILGSLMVFAGCTKEEEWYFPASETQNTQKNEGITQAKDGEEKILIYVCGAVEEPGVVEVEKNARVVDAVTLAGGFTKEADETYINLAAKLQDGEKIYVPTVNEVAQWEKEESEDKLININDADVDSLCKLPGIGESKALDIIAYREKQGSFEKKEDLMKVPGIKENLYEKIKDKIIVK